MGGDDRELLERIKDGDGESFGTLYDRTHKWLLSFVIVPRVGRGDADDVLAETFRFALAEIQNFEWRGTGLLHWLASIARRKSLEHVRKRSAAPDSIDDLPSLLELPDDTPTAEAEMIGAENLNNLKDKVAAVLSSLQPRYAEALRMRLIDGVPRTECAGRMSVTPGTFDVLLHRAVCAFEREWKKP